MYELILNDETIVNVDTVGVGQQGELWIHAKGISLIDCVNIFSNPDKTAQMDIDYGSNVTDSFTGFTVLTSVSVCPDFVKVSLAKGE